MNSEDTPFASDRDYVYFLEAKPNITILYTSKEDSSIDYNNLKNKLLLSKEYDTKYWKKLYGGNTSQESILDHKRDSLAQWQQEANFDTNIGKIY